MATESENINFNELSTEAVQQLLVEATTNCNVKEAIDADDPRFVDLSGLRGEEGNAVKRMRRALLRELEGKTRNITFLVTGHSGSGKSTELKSFKKTLEKEGFLVIYFEAQEALNLEDPGTPDILLAIMYQLNLNLKEADIHVPDDIIQEMESWFVDVFEERNLREIDQKDVETKGEVKLSAVFVKMLGGLAGKFRSVNEWKTKKRKELKKRISEFIEKINIYMDAAAEEIKKKGYRDLILVVDNLEKMGLEHDPEGHTSNHEEIFLTDSEILKAVNCPKFYTVPLSLIYSKKGVSVTGLYTDNFIIPMAGLRNRNGRIIKEAVERFEQIAQKRLEGLHFKNNGALEKIVLFSGGNVKEFIRLLYYVLGETEAGDVPFSDALAELAMNKLMRDYDKSVPIAYFPLLARIHLTKHQTENPEDHTEMLHNLFVLHYVNSSNWYDVHPAIRRNEKFKDALSMEEGAAIAASKRKKTAARGKKKTGRK